MAALICRYFAKGMCRYAQTCRFSHQQVLPKQQEIPREEQKEKPPFQLEIRFPEGNENCYFSFIFFFVCFALLLIILVV